MVDLSTGINPYPYEAPTLPAAALTRLPQPDELARLTAAAAAAYAAPSPDCIVAAPGTQILLPFVFRLCPPGQAAVLGPTYAEHARAAALAGHRVMEKRELGELGAADLAILVNPNNPDGRTIAATDLLALAHTLQGRGGLLVIDEAFMDVGPPGASLALAVGCGNLLVLRSFGKFFGLAGLRLGFAVAAPEIAAHLRAVLGPWALSGPALAIGAAALSDAAWIAAMRRKLMQAAERLDALLGVNRLKVVGGTPLYRLVQTPAATVWFERLGHAGIVVRRFADYPTWLRFGLPGDEPAWQRLEQALACGRQGLAARLVLPAYSRFFASAFSA